MINTSKVEATTVILWSTAWALTLIGSAFLLKGNPAKDWVHAILFIGALTALLWQGQRLACRSLETPGDDSPKHSSHQ